MFSPAPYEPRPIRFAGLIEHAGWRLKRYAVWVSGPDPDLPAFDSGTPALLASLPMPAATPARPGVGFVIAHAGHDPDGSDVRYLVGCWWDQCNELFTRVLVRGARTGDAWTANAGAPCVWDLQIIAHERDACVRRLLTASPDPDGYLQDVFTPSE
ncbi:MAG: hypothetical protein RIB60_02225 [Phycisphaerales bacterium]